LGYRQAEVALALLATDFQQRAGQQPAHSSALMGFISELQKYCNVSDLGSFILEIYRHPNSAGFTFDSLSDQTPSIAMFLNLGALIILKLALF